MDALTYDQRTIKYIAPKKKKKKKKKKPTPKPKSICTAFVLFFYTITIHEGIFLPLISTLRYLRAGSAGLIGLEGRE